MGRDDGTVPVPRRAGLPLRRRRPVPAAPEAVVPTAAETPRVAEISALLGEIDALRTTLTTDLSLAAAALEADQPDLAAEVVTGDLTELHVFERRALGHLRSLDSATPAVQTSADAVVLVPRPLRRRMLPAAPVLAAAAALIGFVVVPGTSSPATPAPTLSSAAQASWELNRLVEQGAPTDELRDAAEEVNDRLAALVAVAGVNPAAAHEALLLLANTTEVLEEAGQPAALADVLAEAKQLAAQLAAVLPQAPRTGTAPRPARVVSSLLPVLKQPAPRRSSATRTDDGTPRTTPAPKPSTAATPAPAPRPTASPTPPAQPAQPSASPAPSGEPILPQPGDLPGG